MLVMEQVTRRTKRSRGLEHFSLHVQPGSCYALVGEAGTGKTQVLQLCAGLLQADEGQIRINGLDMQQRANRRVRNKIIGYAGERDGYFPRLQVLEYLEIFAHAAGMRGLSARERCMETLELMGLEKRKDQLLEEQPRGIRKELSLLRAVLHKPKLLLMDEPFAGVELAQRAVMEELIADLSTQGMTILMTSKSLNEISELCDEIGVMRDGRIVSEGEITKVLSQVRNMAPLYIRVCEDAARAAQVLRKEAQVRTISRDGSHIMVRFDGDEKDEARLLALLNQAGIRVYSFYRAQSSLSDLQEQL